jgi:tetratricopeptide (TPR) repeat protein
LRARELEAAIAVGDAAGERGRNAAGDAPSPPPDAEPYLGASIEIRLERAVARLEERSYLQAVVELAGARGLWPELPEPALLLGKAFFLLDEEALAEEAFREARRIAGGDAAAADRAAFEAAMFYLAQGKGQEALEWIEEVRDAAVQERSKSYIHFWKFQWREAIEAGHRAIAIDRGDSMAHAFLGFALHESGAIDEGLAMLERARLLDSRNPYVPFAMGWILGCAGEIEAAREAYQAAVVLDPGLRLAAHVDLIHVLGGQGRYDEAVIEGRKAAELAGPDDPRPLVSLASTLEDAGRHEEVIEILEEALPLVPRDAYAHSVLALSLFAKGRIGEALAMHEKAVSLPSMRTGVIHNHFGWSLLRAGRLDEAVQVLEKATALFPELSYPHMNLAEVHLCRGELEAAAERYRLALRAPEPTSKAREKLNHRLQLGDGLLRLVRAEEALEAWMEVIELDPEKRGASGRIAALLHSGHDLEPETLRRLILLLESRLDAGAQSPLALAALAVAQLRFEGGMSRALAVLEKHSAIAPYAAIDLLLELAPQEVADAAAAREAGSERLRYLPARLLEEAGRHAEAAQHFEAVAALEEEEIEPLLRLAGCLRAAGRSPEAAARLRGALEGGFAAKSLLWTRWAAVSLADLGLAPGDLLRALPEGAGGEDLRWLLERLAAGEALRINCGGPEHAGAGGELWAADRFSPAGWAQQYLPVEVAGTEEAPLYQRQRLFAGHGPEPVGYRIPLPPGEYRVALHFAEVRFQAAGLRRFDVQVEGAAALEGYEPPLGAAEIRTFDRSVTGGCLDIVFIPRLGEAAVAAIEVRRLE